MGFTTYSADPIEYRHGGCWSGGGSDRWQREEERLADTTTRKARKAFVDANTERNSTNNLK